MLTAVQVANAKPGRHADGNGLYLLVRESGSRSWVFRAQVNGKRQDLGLGSAQKVTLAQARLKAAKLVQSAKAAKRAARMLASQPAMVPTFSEAAVACHEALKPGWRNPHHSKTWLSSLRMHVFPKLGTTPVDEVTTVMVRDALAPVWLTIPETARRILQRVTSVLDYAHIAGWCPHEASLRSVRKGLPRQPVDDQHFESMPYEDVPCLIEQLSRERETAGREALLFTIHTAARSGEVRFAAWGEIDLERGIWSIPGSRMKMGKTHVVPLTSPALAILRRRWPLRTDSGFVFSCRGSHPLSNMTMSKILRDMGHPRITVHGFRSSFTDWAAECTETPKEIVDKALAHQLPDRVEAAYRRTDFFEKRRRLMTGWSTFLCCDPTLSRECSGGEEAHLSAPAGSSVAYAPVPRGPGPAATPSEPSRVFSLTQPHFESALAQGAPRLNLLVSVRVRASG